MDAFSSVPVTVVCAALFLAVLVLGLASKTRNGFALRPQKAESPARWPSF